MIPELYKYTNEQLIEIIYALIGILTGLGIFAIFEIIVYIIKSIFYKIIKKNTCNKNKDMIE